MKVTFPLLGNTYIPIEALLQGLGHEPVTPPAGSKKTLEWGSQHSPEEVCLPFKIILGNMLEGLELGADCVYMIGGWGPCRLGYYAEIQRILLQELGQKAEFITLEVPQGNFALSWNRLRKIFEPTKITEFISGCALSWAKLKVLEDLEQLALQTRPREKTQGSASRLLAKQLKRLRNVQSIKGVWKIGQESISAFQDLVDPFSSAGTLKIGLVGEIYTVVEPFANLRLEERLGHLGVEVIRTISIRQWMKDHIFKNALGLYRQGALKRSAAGYLRDFVGGHGLETIARSVDLSQEGLAGIIHILPLSCMPEIIAQGILPRVSAEREIPILSLVIDEQ
ncbi:MAG: CoA protein activase [Firmicutes bacterium]|nr:CoA protein activase [Bacillota bacterium]